MIPAMVRNAFHCVPVSLASPSEGRFQPRRSATLALEKPALGVVGRWSFPGFPKLGKQGVFALLHGDFYHQLCNDFNVLAQFLTIPTAAHTVFPCCGHRIGGILRAWKASLNRLLIELWSSVGQASSVRA
jgi:hypothetical protein